MSWKTALYIFLGYEVLAFVVNNLTTGPQAMGQVNGLPFDLLSSFLNFASPRT